MSDEWDSGLPITKLILPTNGVEAPLTGTSVFGPLPADLVAQLPGNATGGGIIWYSQTSPGYKYWFIAEVENQQSGGPANNYYYGAVIIGFVFWNGRLQFSTFSGQQISMMANSGELLLDADYNLTGDTELTLRSTVQNIFTNYRQQFWSDTSGIDNPVVEVDIYASDKGGWMTDSKSTTIDKWQTLTQTATVSSAANTRLDWYWRISFDRIVEIRCTMTFTVAPAVGPPNVNAPPAIPLQSNPGSAVAYGSYGGPSLTQTGVVRYGTNNRQWLMSNVPAIAQAYTGSVTFTADKPVY